MVTTFGPAGLAGARFAGLQATASVSRHIGRGRHWVTIGLLFARNSVKGNYDKRRIVKMLVLADRLGRTRQVPGSPSPAQRIPSPRGEFWGLPGAPSPIMAPDRSWVVIVFPPDGADLDKVPLTPFSLKVLVLKGYSEAVAQLVEQRTFNP